MAGELVFGWVVQDKKALDAIKKYFAAREGKLPENEFGQEKVLNKLAKEFFPCTTSQQSAFRYLLYVAWAYQIANNDKEAEKYLQNLTQLVVKIYKDKSDEFCYTLIGKNNEKRTPTSDYRTCIKSLLDIECLSDIKNYEGFPKYKKEIEEVFKIKNVSNLCDKEIKQYKKYIKMDFTLGESRFLIKKIGEKYADSIFYRLIEKLNGNDKEYLKKIKEYGFYESYNIINKILQNDNFKLKIEFAAEFGKVIQLSRSIFYYCLSEYIEKNVENKKRVAKSVKEKLKIEIDALYEATNNSFVNKNVGDYKFFKNYQVFVEKIQETKTNQNKKYLIPLKKEIIKWAKETKGFDRFEGKCFLKENENLFDILIAKKQLGQGSELKLSAPDFRWGVASKAIYDMCIAVQPKKGK